MSKHKDLIGEKFNRLIVIEKVGLDKNNQMQWLCECECGNMKIVTSHNLLNGSCKSCGCLNKELVSNRNRMRAIHGDCGTRLYHIWADMKSRCTNQNNPYFYRYGGRGITIYEEWCDSYVMFKEWALQNGYQKDLTLDRKNNDGNYEPSNCRWVNMSIQQNNKSSNKLLTYNGQTKTISEWSNELNIPCGTLYNRLHKGWSVEKTLETPRNAHKLKFKTLTYKGKTQTILQWAKELNLPRLVIYNRLHYGWSVEKTLGTSVAKRK